MQDTNTTVDRRFDAAFVGEQATLDRSSTGEPCRQASDSLRLNLEVAIEWAHLGGD